jgi:uncharacterized membrane protein YbhN (UPF0104 family)
VKTEIPNGIAVRPGDATATRTGAGRRANLQFTITFRLVLSLLIAGFVVWSVVQFRADLERLPLADLWNARATILAAAILSALSYALRAVRWKWYLRRLGHNLPTAFLLVSYVAGFAFTLSPAKLGELGRAPYYLARGVPLRDIVAAFGVERLMDLLAITAFASLLITSIPSAGRLIAAAAAVSITALCLFWLMGRRRWGHVAESTPWMPGVIARRWTAAHQYLNIARPLLMGSSFAIGLLLSVAVWGLEALGLRIVASALTPVHIDLQVAIGIYGVSLLAGALSFLPGGLGTTESVMATLLSSRGYSMPAALGLTLTCRVVTLWFGISLGWLAMVTLRLSPLQRAALPARTTI